MVKRPWCLGMVLLLGIQTVLTAGFRVGKDWKPSTLELAVEKGTNIEWKGTVSFREEKANVQVYYLTDNQVCLNDQILKESKILVYVKQEQSQIKRTQTEQLQTERIQTGQVQREKEQTEGAKEREQKIAIGNQIFVKGKVDYFESARNPGNFDQKFYYQKQGIHVCVWADEVKMTGRETWNFRETLCVLRGRWNKLLVEFLGEKYGNSMSAILLGEKGGLDPELKELYQKSGIGHILVISGLHLSFVGIGIYQILRRLTGSYSVGGILGILLLGVYILLTGFTVSSVRALVMFLFRVGADMAGRHYDAPTALATAAVVVLQWRPLSVFDGGFWLSFGAVLAILLLVPVVQGMQKREAKVEQRKKRGASSEHPVTHALCGTDGQYSLSGKVSLSGHPVFSVLCTGGRFMSDKVWRGIWQSIFQGMAASIGINLMIFPVLLYYFFEFPTYSFLLNLLVIPLTSVLLFLGMAGSFFYLLFRPMSELLFASCGVILGIYEKSCQMVLRLPGSRLVTGKPELWQVMMYYGILFLGLFLLRDVLSSEKQKEQESRQFGKGIPCSGRDAVKKLRENRRKKRGVLFLWMIGFVILTVRWSEAGKLTAVILDVGQGDGIFMKGPEGGTYLIDGGSSDVKKVGQYRLESFLKSQGVGALDYVLISHGDSDHMNGVEELIERQDVGVKIKTLVLPVQEVWDEALEELAKEAVEHGIRVAVIEPEQRIREGGMMITCIQPGRVERESGTIESGQKGTESEKEDAEPKPGNAASMVLAVRYGEFDMLLTGDVEEKGEEQLIEQLGKQYRDCTWEVLKVAHHGSKNSSTEAFLRQVRPAYALLSAGQENRYGHPHEETIERLIDAGSKIYSTQENGALIVEVEDGETWKIKKY